ncbi:MAG: TetR/AcrR family transcriptional regulator [Spirochaetaceae bacterium]|jgi:AcrR family transcriptional regulator|nr:TetR/AcrR family transcriptional regulator [Spirochaetaceae bacterium]
MSIVVEHEKRRREILEKALDIFMEEGFENATFQKIADRCGITRTTLYIYFKNKREIFNYSIKQLLGALEWDISGVRDNKELTCPDKLLRVISLILERLEENRRLLRVILDFLLYLSKNDGEVETKVRRRTLRLRHIIATMVIEGIRSGEIKAVNVRTADDLFYSLIESAIFRLVVLKRPSAGELKQAVELTISQMRLA